MFSDEKNDVLTVTGIRDGILHCAVFRKSVLSLVCAFRRKRGWYRFAASRLDIHDLQAKELNDLSTGKAHKTPWGWSRVRE